MANKQVEIRKDGCGLYVSYTRNGSQWNGFCGSESFKNCKIMLKAFVEIGYKDTTNYDALSEDKE